MLAPSICNGPPCRCSTTYSISLVFLERVLNWSTLTLSRTRERGPNEPLRGQLPQFQNTFLENEEPDVVGPSSPLYQFQSRR